MTLTEEIASRYGIAVAEVERYEGVLATLAERRERLSKRWARKIKPVPRTIAKSFPTATVVSAAAAQFHASGIGPASPSSDDMGASSTPKAELYTLRRDTAKALALVWLRSWLRANPDTEKDWAALVSLAEAEAAAEGVTQATALLADSGRLDVPVDLDQLYRDTLAQLAHARQLRLRSARVDSRPALGPRRGHGPGDRRRHRPQLRQRGTGQGGKRGHRQGRRCAGLHRRGHKHGDEAGAAGSVRLRWRRDVRLHHTAGGLRRLRAARGHVLAS